MTTEEERAALRKDIGRVGRAELLRLLEDAWRQLDEIEQTERGPAPDDESSGFAIDLSGES